MQHRSWRSAAVAAVALLLGTLPGAAQDDVPGLGDMLNLIPESPTIAEAAPIFSYVDFRAVERAGGVPRPDSEAAFVAGPDAARRTWEDALMRIWSGPPELIQRARPGLNRADESLAAVMGFDWFAIDRAMIFGRPPSTVTVLAGGPGLTDMAALEAALGPRGFALETRAGVPVWHRFEDHRINVEEITPSDPFGGSLGRAARIAVEPGLLIGTSAWPDLDAILAVRQGQAPAAALARLLRATAAAIVKSSGSDIIQAQAFALPGLAAPALPLELLLPENGQLPDPEALAEAMAPPEGPALPPYPVALLADLHVGEDQVAVIALPYADRDSAATAAEVVAERVRTWMPVPGETPFVAEANGRVETSVLEAPALAPAVAAAFLSLAADGALTGNEAAIGEVPPGGAVAVVAVRYPIPERGGEMRAVGGWLWSRWLHGIYNREFTPLNVP